MWFDLDAIVVVDADRRLKGVVERDHVISRMMLALDTFNIYLDCCDLPCWGHDATLGPG